MWCIGYTPIGDCGDGRKQSSGADTQISLSDRHVICISNSPYVTCTIFLFLRCWKKTDGLPGHIYTCWLIESKLFPIFIKSINTQTLLILETSAYNVEIDVTGAGDGRIYIHPTMGFPIHKPTRSVRIVW